MSGEGHFLCAPSQHLNNSYWTTLLLESQNISNSLPRSFRYLENSGTIRFPASVAKLVDALDLGSSVFDVTVRVRPLAPRYIHQSVLIRIFGNQLDSI